MKTKFVICAGVLVLALGCSTTTKREELEKERELLVNCKSACQATLDAHPLGTPLAISKDSMYLLDRLAETNQKIKEIDKQLEDLKE